MLQGSPVRPALSKPHSSGPPQISSYLSTSTSSGLCQNLTLSMQLTAATCVSSQEYHYDARHLLPNSTPGIWVNHQQKHCSPHPTEGQPLLASFS